MWQKCPICNGTGNDPRFNSTCSTCNGTKIISELTGLPPSHSQSSDFRDQNMESQQEYFGKK